MEGELEQIRAELDRIDKELVELFRARMELSGRAAEYKRDHNLPVLAAGRERELLSRVSGQAGDELAGYAQMLYQTLLAVSRAHQHAKIEAGSSMYDILRRTLEATAPLFPTRAVTACQGIEGAYSQIVCDKLFKAPDIRFYPTFAGVFQAVERGECRYGILPIENSTAGSVKGVYDLMDQYNFSIVRSARMKISHNLLSLPGTTLEDVKEVLSHEQAISQCAGYLARRGVKATVAANTALAARMVRESGRHDLAALSSRLCAEHYGLSILAENVQDQDSNYTRFICISKQPEIYPGADRTSLMLTLPHRPGSLYNVMSIFAALGINLIKLESRPLPGREFEFMFYFDLEESVYAPELERMFLELEAGTERLRWLGTYSEVMC